MAVSFDRQEATVTLMDRLFKRPAPRAEVVGCWQLVQAPDAPSEPAEVDFRPDGRLFYSVLSGDRWQIMKLTYQVEGEMLVTDQPSSPRKEKTRFALEEDGRLMLEFGGQRSWFRRGPKMAPEA
jgi:hypothetical protein